MTVVEENLAGDHVVVVGGSRLSGCSHSERQ